MNNRAGEYAEQLTGYHAFVPKKLPPFPSIIYDDEMQELLSFADRKLGRLDGITEVLPNPDFFVAMYVRKEALLSSQIEGTQASLIDVIDIEDENKGLDVEEVVNYVRAMNYGLLRLSELPLCLRLIREIHYELLASGRGSTKDPGNFRASQNWIGPPGSTLNTAIFVPPAVSDMIKAMNDLEEYLYNKDPIPALIKIALVHAQFETIHPFLDGNGRVGRLLITFWLCQQKILSRPLLYLSYYFKLNKSEYYDRLMAVREKGEWENWIKFFLRGIAIASDESIESAKEIINLRTELSGFLYSQKNTSGNHQRLLDLIFEYPVINISFASRHLNISHPTATKIIEAFEKNNILNDITPKKIRNKRYIFKKYYTILERGT